jgi:chaperone modulatory protein CbpM
MQVTSVLALFADLEETELSGWIARGWVRPEEDEAGWEFHEIDVARVRLIRDLRHTMAVGEEAMPVVLSLLDQVYELRGTLRELLRALDTQPELVRSTILGAVRRR